ncbi:hypothetical protein PG987_015792 [Apiospora arundinis]
MGAVQDSRRIEYIPHLPRRPGKEISLPLSRSLWLKESALLQPPQHRGPQWAATTNHLSPHCPFAAVVLSCCRAVALLRCYSAVVLACIGLFEKFNAVTSESVALAAAATATTQLQQQRIMQCNLVRFLHRAAVMGALSSSPQHTCPGCARFPEQQGPAMRLATT